MEELLEEYRQKFQKAKDEANYAVMFGEDKHHCRMLIEVMNCYKKFVADLEKTIANYK